QDRPGAVDVESVAGHVAFRQVNFNHQGRVGTLRDVTFEARPGQTVAIVGPTGAGKTTLVSLLLRFYDFADGHILLDRQDVRGIPTASLRRQISVVLQEPLLFSGTVAENIRFAGRRRRPRRSSRRLGRPTPTTSSPPSRTSTTPSSASGGGCSRAGSGSGSQSPGSSSRTPRT